MKKHIIIAVLLLSSSIIYSQQVLLSKDVKGDTIVAKHGPNLKNFGHLYVSYGTIIGDYDNSLGTKYGYSDYFNLGYRYKLKVSNFYAIGYDIELNANAFRLKNDTVFNPIIYKVEKLQFYNLGIGVYNRFSLNKRRGNFIGKFIDIGAKANWCYNLKYFTKDKFDNGVIRTQKSYRRPEFHNDINYGIIARIGTSRYVISGYYRLSDLFMPSKNLPEAPRINIGLEIGLFK